MTEIARVGPSITDCLEAAMRADPSLTIEEAIRTVPISETIRQANLAIAEAREAAAADLSGRPEA
jgi:hypothetical protein